MVAFPLAVMLLPLGQLPESASDPNESIRFVDVARLAGVRAAFHSDFRPGRYFLPTVMGGGVAFFDADNDGWMDLFFTTGCRLPIDAASREAAGALYRNLQNATFANCAGIGFDGPRYGQGVAAADFDNDGFVDLVLTSLEGCALYRNHGDGTFTALPASAGVVADGWPTGAAFGDLDRDGDLDLYIARYVATSLADTAGCMYQQGGTTVRGFCGPSEFGALADVLYANDGAGSFTDVTRAAGCAEATGKGLGVVIADLTGDGWPDVYVANDTTANFLWENVTGRSAVPRPADRLRFLETAERHGSAFRADGQPGGSMGIGVGDWDADGRLDLAVTEYLGEGTSLYNNRSDGFSETSRRTGLASATVASLGFGVAFLDADNDGWLDLFQANGHVLGPNVEPSAMRAQVFWSRGKQLLPVARWAGPYFFNRHLARGAAVGDFNNDGRCDLAVVHLDEPAALLRNQCQNANHFVGIELIGTRSNRGGVGAQVRADAGGQTRTFEVMTGSSYLSSSDPRILIGLGRETVVGRVVVRWTDGNEAVIERPAVDQYLTVIEGRVPGATPAR
jgi:hypothetical protein